MLLSTLIKHLIQYCGESGAKLMLVKLGYHLAFEASHSSVTASLSWGGIKENVTIIAEWYHNYLI